MSAAEPSLILDAGVSQSRDGGPSFTFGNRVFRAIWNLSWVLLGAWTPRSLHPWRRLLLKAFGAKVGLMSDVRGSARVWYPPHLTLGDYALLADRVICYNMAPIVLGKRALVSQGAHLCAGSHDITDAKFQLISWPITIGDEVWIAAEAFVGPGVTIGDGAVLGARGVAKRDLDAWSVYSGNPAVFLKKRVLRP